MDEEIKIGKFVKNEETLTYKTEVLVSENYLHKLQEAAEYMVIEKISDRIVEDFVDQIEFEIDFADIAKKVQQAIINKLTIKQLRETIKYEGKIE